MWSIDCKNGLNSSPLPLSTHFAMSLYSSSHKGLESMSPPFSSGSALWLALANRIWQKWQCASPEPGPKRPWTGLLSLSWKPAKIPCEQAWSSLRESETSYRTKTSYFSCRIDKSCLKPSLQPRFLYLWTLTRMVVLNCLCCPNWEASTLTSNISLSFLGCCFSHHSELTVNQNKSSYNHDYQ